jgi:hypothetical protein
LEVSEVRTVGFFSGWDAEKKQLQGKRGTTSPTDEPYSEPLANLFSGAGTHAFTEWLTS